MCAAGTTEWDGNYRHPRESGDPDFAYANAQKIRSVRENNSPMPKFHEHWKVLPHGRLTEIDPNILTVVGNIHMPLTELPRRMTVARLAGRRLVIFSAIALDEENMRRLDAYGRPAFLVVPSDKHRLDARIWKDRYPALQV